MAIDSINLDPTTERGKASGTADTVINLNWGINSSRLPRKRKYILKHNGSEVGNTLIVTQKGVDLAVSTNNPQTGVSVGGTITITGTANGKYIWYETSTTDYFVITNAYYTIGSTTANFSDGFTEVSGYTGGVYSYSVTLTATSAPASNNYTPVIYVYTNDYATDRNSKYAASTINISSSGEGEGGDSGGEEGGGGSTVSDIRVTGVQIKVAEDSPFEGNPIRTDVSNMPEDYGIFEAVVGTNPSVFDGTLSDHGVTVTWGTEGAAGIIAVSQYSDDPCRCKVVGKNQGVSTLVVNVSDGVNTVSARYIVQTKDRGIIGVDPIFTPVIIRDHDNSAEFRVTVSNIDTSKGFKIYNSDEEKVSWIGINEDTGELNSGSVNLTNNKVIINGIRDNNTSAERTATFTVVGTDIFGTETLSNNFTLRQEFNSIYPCESLSIAGTSSIYNYNNSYQYSVTYSPSNTNQKNCRWELTDTQGNAVNSSIAYLSNTGDFNATVNIGSSAQNNTQLILRAIHQKDGSDSTLPVATKTITVRYYVQPDVVISGVTGSAVSLGYGETQDDTPRIRFVNSDFQNDGIRIASDDDGIFDMNQHPYLEETSTGSGIYKLVVALNPNTSHSSKSGKIEIHASNNDYPDVYATIQYEQAGVPASTSKFMIVDRDHDSPAISNLGIVTSSKLIFSIDWMNMASGSVTFVNPTWTLTLFNDNTQMFTESGTLSDMTVATVYPTVSTSQHNVELSQIVDGYDSIILEVRCGNITGSARYTTEGGSVWVED